MKNLDTSLALGNASMRAGNFEDAIRHYARVLLKAPGLAKHISANFVLARRKYLRERQCVKKPRVGVCGWDLGRNPAGRAYTLAMLYEDFADVEIVGSIFPKYGRQIWEPIRGSRIAKHCFVADDESRYIDQAIELVADHPCDIVHLSKPRAPNIFLGILYKLIWGAKVIVDVDDDELAFFGDDASVGIDEYIQKHHQLPALADLAGKNWTRLAVGLAESFDGVTVSNTVLKQRYGGQVIQHARNEKLFDASPEFKRKCREKHGVPQEKKVVLFFGTPRTHKGLLETAEAIAALKRNDLVFVIVGEFSDAALKARLQAIAGVEYLFIGNQPIESAPEIAAVGDVCVLLQDVGSAVAQRQIPAKLSDALAVGMPVLASETQALVDVFARGALLAVTPETLSAKLGQVLSDSGTADRLSEAGRAYFHTELGHDTNVLRLRQAVEQYRNLPLSKGGELLLNSLDANVRETLQYLLNTADARHPGSEATNDRGGVDARQLATGDAAGSAGARPWANAGRSGVSGRIAVVVHYFYPEIWPEICGRLERIGTAFDLFVTAPVELASSAHENVLRSFPNARFAFGPNRGMDILPFLSLIPTLINERYMAVCKIHTKRGYDESAVVWRNVMLDSLLGSDDSFSSVVRAFDEHPELCLAGPAMLYQSAPRLMYENKTNVSRILRESYGRDIPETDWGFFAGTMFWVRPELLEKICEYATFHIADQQAANNKDGKLEHALERAFGLLPTIYGGSVGLLHGSSSGEGNCTLQLTNNSAFVGKADVGAALAHRASLARYVDAIRKAGVFDEALYRFQYSEELPMDVDALAHYILIGCFSGKRPVKSFSPTQYLSQNQDVRRHRVEPLFHYLSSGAREGRLLFSEPEREPQFRFEVLNRTLIDWNRLAAESRKPRTLDVSIVIPVYGQPELTVKCVQSILNADSTLSWEVILVDNGSDPVTAAQVEKLKSGTRVKVVRNWENLNFALGCNVGFAHASGKSVVFLNNDTTVTNGWLEKLVRPLADAKVMAVQPKLLFPDGTLQCGGVVFSRWSALGYPIYVEFPGDAECINKSRPFQAITAACIALRSEDFAEIEGFDPVFINGQEDIDLCLRLRERFHGHCWYAADATVIHYEGKTPGRGKYIAHNRAKFIARWSEKHTPDDFSYYAEDGYVVKEWRVDSERNLERGIAVYRPAVARAETRTTLDREHAVSWPITDVSGDAVVPKRDTFVGGKRSIRPDAPWLLLCAHAAGTQLFGGERSFLDMLVALNGCGFNVVATFPGFGNEEYLAEVLQYVHALYVFEYHHWQKEVPMSRSAVERFSAIVKKHSIDAVYVNTIVIREPLLAARECGVPSVVHVREMISNDEHLSKAIGMSPEDIARHVYASADYVVANSRTTAQALGHPDRTFVAPNVVDLTCLDVPNPIYPGEITFALISSNIPKKGIYDLVEVARICERIAPAARFWLVGPERKEISELMALQESGRIPRNVVFAGYKQTPREALVGVNVVLNLSLFAESFGRTVAEALSAGRPVIAYDWGALGELVQSGKTGFLVPYRDVAQVAQKVRALCANPALIDTFGEAGRQFVLEKYTPATLQGNLGKAFSKILGREQVVNEVSRAADQAKQMLKLATERYGRFPSHAVSRDVTVIVPVYNALNESIACIESVIANTDPQHTRLLVIDDGSPDQQVFPALSKFDGVGNVTVVRNERNIGYTKTVNRGLKLAGTDDVVLLNSDTVVTSNWLLGLRIAAYGPDSVGTVTAMSDNAGAFSFPVPGRANPKPDSMSYDEYASVVLSGSTPKDPIELPTGNGFCMYIKRELVDKIGAFDEEAFPRGYGEENDFCMRGLKAGYKNLLSPWSFVFHVRTASFKGEKAKLVAEGNAALEKLHPDYPGRVREAFSSSAIKDLHSAVQAAVREYDVRAAELSQM
ncbi:MULTISPECIES: glycosyltransferase [unclassified Burkholderia]|uniref:glycosyltransferase n=1 Tax=unclassified Burkholderia TaxID=2613784 RepID=UPI002ABE464C|nr:MULTISPECIES: glycosyltransferase [unclassified Burkholderia]